MLVKVYYTLRSVKMMVVKVYHALRNVKMMVVKVYHALRNVKMMVVKVYHALCNVKKPLGTFGYIRLESGIKMHILLLIILNSISNSKQQVTL